MKRWTVTLRKPLPPDLRIDGSIFNPVAWDGIKNPSKLDFKIGGHRERMGDWLWFAIDEQDDAPEPVIHLNFDAAPIDRIGAAADGQRIGIDGGRIEITGNSGDLLGHRMRRGMIVVGGNAGRFCGGNMIAGTLVIGGTLGDGVMMAARRGTLIVPQKPTLSAARFTRPVSVDFPLAAILKRSANSTVETVSTAICRRGAMTSRADLCEVVWPR